MAIDLLRKLATSADPYGVSFHSASQQTDLGQWDGAVGTCRAHVLAARRGRHHLRMINIGGGFPALTAARCRKSTVMPRRDGGDNPVFRNDLRKITSEPGTLAGR